MLIVDRGIMYHNILGGVCFFFDIDVKGGESVVISRMLQWYSCMLFKGLPSMPKGEIVGMFSDRGRVFVFIIDGDFIDDEDQHDQYRSDNGMTMARSTVNSNSDHWIPFRILDDRQI
jgi:hypothetical protein